MKMEFNATKVVEEIVMQAEENLEEFIIETIHPYCENILQIKISKEELKQILLNGIQQPNRCDSCIHSEEQDGSNCYECVKGISDNFEAQPTDADCISRKSIRQKLQEEHDFFVNAYGGNFKDMPYEEKVRVDEITNCIAMVVNEPPVTPSYNSIKTKTPSYNSIKTELKPCEDCISKEEMKKIVDAEFVDLQDGTEEWRDYVNDTCLSILENMQNSPSVTPQSKTGHWIDEGQYAEGHSEHAFRCSECGGHIIEYEPDAYCKYCGAEMEVEHESNDME